jgi:hypothetical protein
MQRILASAVLATGLSLTLGCQTDLDLESKTWACEADSDCRGGQVCVGASAGEKGLCEPASADASMDTQEDAGDTSTSDADDTGDTSTDTRDTNDTGDGDVADTTDTSEDTDTADAGDDDEDGVPNPTDNCPDTPNPGQTNTDRDGEGDACDLTRSLSNASQVASGPGGARLGASVAGGENIGGNALADLLVGAPGESRAYLIEGNSGGSVALPTSGPNFLPNEVRSGEFGANVAIIGPYLGKATAEFVVQAPAASSGAYVEAYTRENGAPKTISQLFNGTSTTVGTGIADAANFDTDAMHDFFVGDPSSNTGDGALFLFLGSSSSQLNGDRSLSELIEIRGDSGDRLGASIVNIGDLGAGSYDQLAVGAPGNEKVYIFTLNGDTEVPSTLTGGTACVIDASGSGLSSGFGESLANVGDLNGDQIDDLAVGQPDENGGRVLIFDGSMLATNASLAPSDAIITLEAANLGDDFGTSISRIGDVDLDGTSDLLIGAPGVDNSDNSDVGAAYIVPGTVMSAQSSPISSTEFIALFGEGANANAGQSVAWLRDFNDDGVSDFAVGAPGTSSDNGALYVYLGPIIYGPQN